MDFSLKEVAGTLVAIFSFVTIITAITQIPITDKLWVMIESWC